MTDEPAAPHKVGSHGPTWLPKLLVVLATVLAVVSTMTTWVHSQALDTNQWVKSSDQLLEKPEVREALSNYLADQLFATVDVKAEIESALPKNLAGLAGPIAGALRAPTTDAIDRIISSDRFRAVWENANRIAHKTLVAVLRGDSRRNLSTSDGKVVLDLGGAIRSVGITLGVSESALNKIPANAGQVTIFQSDALAKAQTTVKILDFMSWFLFIVVVATYALAVYLAVGHRRLMLRAVGVGLIVGSFVLLMIRAVGIRTSINLFVHNSSNEPTARAVGAILTGLLRQSAWTGIVYGVLIVAFAELLGDRRWAVATRRFVAGMTDSTTTLVSAAVVVVAVLMWWSPGRAFDRWVTALTLVALVIGALVTLVVTGRKELEDTSSRIDPVSTVEGNG